MKTPQKVLTYATGFALGCLVLFMIPREKESPKEHPWHRQTALEGTFPMDIVDDTGRRVRINRQPRYVISLAPSITEMIYAMGLGDHLMAVTKWCNYPQEAKALRDAGAHIGAMDQPNRETIAAYQPDLIIGTDLTPPEIYTAIENPPKTVAIALSHDSMDDVMQDVAMIGKVMGVPGNALKLISDLKAKRDQVDKRLNQFRNAPPKRVLFLLSVSESGQPGWTPGENTWVNDLLVSAHSVNVASELGKSWGEVSYEALISLDPDVILIRDGKSEVEKERLRQTIESLRTHPVWEKVEAVRENRIHVVEYGPFNIPGPRIIEAYKLISDAIWPPQSGQMP